MNQRRREIAAAIILLVLALPSGLCSGFFTVGGIAASFDRDPVANVAGTLFLVGAAVGWAFCALMILLWRRLRRQAADPDLPGT